MDRQLSFTAPASAEPEWMQFLPQHSVSTTFGELCEHRLARHRAEGRLVRDLESAYRHHLIPAFGALEITALETRHFVAWGRWALVAGGVKKKGLERSTVQKLLALAAAVLSDAVTTKTLAFNPAHLPRSALDEPEAVDRLALAREVPTVREMERLIYDPRIAFERRAFWALLLLAGLRFGEGAALRWSSYKPNQPLHELEAAESYDTKDDVVRARTKTGTTKHVPVHPVLAEVLDELRGWWTVTFGRVPLPRDILAPRATRRGHPKPRREDVTLREWKADLEVIGASSRKLHRTRNAFITRLTEAGADEAVVREMTHPKPASAMTAFEGYRHFDWIPRCRAVLCLRLERRSAQLDLFNLPAARGGDAGAAAARAGTRPTQPSEQE